MDGRENDFLKIEFKMSKMSVQHWKKQITKHEFTQFNYLICVFETAITVQSYDYDHINTQQINAKSMIDQFSSDVTVLKDIKLRERQMQRLFVCFFSRAL